MELVVCFTELGIENQLILKQEISQETAFCQRIFFLSIKVDNNQFANLANVFLFKKRSVTQIGERSGRTQDIFWAKIYWLGAFRTINYDYEIISMSSPEKVLEETTRYIEKIILEMVDYIKFAGFIQGDEKLEIKNHFIYRGEQDE